MAHRAIATHKKMVYVGFQCLGHPPYSPDLAPSDYHLFPGLKKAIEREVGRAKDLSAPGIGTILGASYVQFSTTRKITGTKARLQEIQLTLSPGLPRCSLLDVTSLRFYTKYVQLWTVQYCIQESEWLKFIVCISKNLA
jgi:hypothetical protein